jgi:hypothetical protein
MASFDLFTYFQHDMILERTWWINGRNYARTLEDWLRLQDKNNKNDSSVKALQKDAVARGVREEDGRASFHRYAFATDIAFSQAFQLWTSMVMMHDIQ